MHLKTFEIIPSLTLLRIKFAGWKKGEQKQVQIEDEMSNVHVHVKCNRNI